jgi:hypothetical protein
MKWRKPADGERVKGNPPASEGGRYTGGLAGAPPQCGKEKGPEMGTGPLVDREETKPRWTYQLNFSANWNCLAS